MAKVPQIETVEDLLHLTGLELYRWGSDKTIAQLRLNSRSRPALIQRATRWYKAWQPATRQLADAIDRALAQQKKSANELYWAFRLEVDGNIEASRLLNEPPLPAILNPPLRTGNFEEFSRLLKLLREIGNKL